MHHKIRWTHEKLTQRLSLIKPLAYRERQAISPFRFTILTDPMETPPLEADDSGWEIIEPHTYWAYRDTNFLLRTSFEIPATWQSPVALHLPLGDGGSFSHPEALIYIDGIPYAACDRHHQEVLLSDKYQDGNTHQLDLHGWSGNNHPGGKTQGRLYLHPCEVVQIDQVTRDFVTSARVALQVTQQLDDNHPAKPHLLNALDQAFKLLDTREPLGEKFYNSVPSAHTILRNGIKKAGQAMDVDLTAVGHAHIDVAWLWTLGQTRRKAGRTFHTVLRLMEQFPDYHFAQSQSQLYDYVRQDYPQLFEAIKSQVANGRWEPIGGMWVEADCNISGAESLARQFLLGRSFFKEHFGKNVESPVLWLPDVFGYSWSLPQLIKLAGLDYFLTIKISWNQYNRLPYDSFWWQGLDGTRVLTHFSTTPGWDNRANYNATATPQEVLGSWQCFQQKDLQRNLLMMYGYGDGGGGPTREMLENLSEMADFPGLPRAHTEKAINFFRRMEAQAGEKLPTWNGELYLEYHRGTYTTQSRNKRANRKSEFLLHDAEFLATLAALLDKAYNYPADALRHAWELVCLNQFHDIIPGSSITPVYTESLEQYAEIEEIGQQICAAASAVIADQIHCDLLVVNPTSFEREDLIFWEEELEEGRYLQTTGGMPVFTQRTLDGTWISASKLPAYSITALHITETAAPIPETGLHATTNLLENAFLRVEFNEAGDIVRLYDKANQRDVLPPGAVANQFQAFEDRPMNWDAWDIDIYYDDKMWLSDPAHSIEVIEAGPLRATLEIKRRILNSLYVQRISLQYNSPQLRFDTEIDWEERHILLKTAFPVDVLSPRATYEIQWGNVERPTHRNTSWDWARFETCAQKWVDLSEGDYGVSLLNDCKYGHDIQQNTIRLSLLRSPTHPDPEADQGIHHFSYILLPHAGDWKGSTIPAAYALNDPLRIFVGSPEEKATEIPTLLQVNCKHVVVETIKQAEDENGIIVRLYECHRKRGMVTLTMSFEVGSASIVNLLEEDEQILKPHGHHISVPIKPYQILTLRLVPAVDPVE